MGCPDGIAATDNGKRSVGCRHRSSGTTMIELYEQQITETRRMNGYLERIALSMEKHEPPRGN